MTASVPFRRMASGEPNGIEQTTMYLQIGHLSAVFNSFSSLLR